MTEWVILATAAAVAALGVTAGFVIGYGVGFKRGEHALAARTRQMLADTNEEMRRALAEPRPSAEQLAEARRRAEAFEREVQKHRALKGYRP